MAQQDIYAGDYNIDTPESVAFDYTLADVGNRSLAALLDMFLVFLALIGLNLVLVAILRSMGVSVEFFDLEVEGAGWLAGLVIALYAILDFVVFWGYFMLLELKWNGQTIGKQALKIRVVRLDGSPAGASEIAVRNLVRIIDFLPSGYLFGLLVMLLDGKGRRLGDLAAGTIVVKADMRVTLDELVRKALVAQQQPPTVATAAPVAETHDAPSTPGLEVRGLRPADYSLVLDVLSRDARTPLQDELLVRLATAIAAKIRYDGDVSANPRQFLQQVSDAYRRKG